MGRPVPGRRPSTAAWLHVALGLTTLIALVTPAWAFLVQTYEGEDGVVALRWPSTEIPFVFNAAGSDDLEPEQAFAILRTAFDTWEQVAASSVTFTDQGIDAGAGANRRDRRNVLTFDEAGLILAAPPGTGVIAVTRLNSDVATGRITDADIIFNGRDFSFAAEPRPGRISLLDVAVHEVGHFLGLDHTPLDGSAGTRPTMNPFYFGDGPGEAASLEADDVAGIGFLYPTPLYRNRVGSISGRVTDAQGTPLFGAHVVARATDGSLISTLSGAETGRDAPGLYTLHGLLPGEYTVHIEPFPAGTGEDSFSGIFAGLATDVPFEYYDNVERLDLAQRITVPRGSLRRVQGIDITTGLALPGYPLVTPLLEPVNTPDVDGPYAVRVRATSADQVELQVEVEGADGGVARRTIVMQPLGQALFSGQIPGQQAGSHVRYRVVARGDDGRTTAFPGAQTWLDFEIVTLSGAPLVFAVLRSAGAVSIFDTGTEREISRVHVGDDPIQLVSSADGRLLFVADLRGGMITVLDGATFRVVDRIEVGSAPLDMALSGDGGTLYVTNSDAGTLTAIDVESHTVRQKWSVSQTSEGPYGVTTSASGRIYVTDLNADEILVLEDGRVIRRLAAPAQPRSLTTSADGNTIYVASFSSGLLGRIDDRSGELSTSDLGVSGTFAIVAHPRRDRLYLTAHEEDLLLVVQTSTGAVLRRIEVGDNPRGLSFSPDLRLLFVTSATSEEIHLVDTVKDSVVGIWNASGGPRGIVVIESPAVLSTVITEAPVPAEWSLSQVYPNPFNPEARLRLVVGATAAKMHLDVYNPLGQRVRRLWSAPAVTPGQRLTIIWDGRDSNGRPAASGLYLFLMESPRGRMVRKGLLLR